MVLFPQAVIDDSGSEPKSPTFILAGLVAPFGAWIAFIAEWRAILDKSPKLDYFKMSEAGSMTEQFHPSRGWTETLRDTRVLELAQVAAKYGAIRIHASIKHDDFERYIASVPAPERKLSIDRPYLLMFLQIIMALATGGDQFGLCGACDYIFDEQGAFGEEALNWWPNFKQSINAIARSDIKKFIGNRPMFRDEKDFLPLQAADLYAWHIRKHANLTRNGLIIPASTVLRQFENMPAIGRNYGKKELNSLREHMLEAGALFATTNPHIPLHPLGKTKSERKKLRKKTKGALAGAAWSIKKPRPLS
jgi:hypothetical protein